MAGMFYSLSEVAEKLGKTEEQIRDIVKDGRLREFRDGTSLLFKVDEVEALMDVPAVMETPPPLQAEPLEEPEPPKQDELIPELAPPLQFTEQDDDEVILQPASSEDTFVDANMDISLETDTGMELTNADTAAANEGISILGETDTEYKLAEDTSSDTREASLEEIEEDVNLDTFGSGSGLLDLSLQADDTSLGGILDEIYTTDDQSEQFTNGGSGSGFTDAHDSDQMLSSSGIASPEFASQPSSAAKTYIEPEPDAVSNAMGISLFLPLIAIIYASIIIFTSFGKGTPKILKMTQDFVLHGMIGIIVAAFLIIGIAFMVGGSDKPKKAKTKKAKPKKVKQKKAKKAKKAKD